MFGENAPLPPFLHPFSLRRFIYKRAQLYLLSSLMSSTFASRVTDQKEHDIFPVIYVYLTLRIFYVTFYLLAPAVNRLISTYGHPVLLRRSNFRKLVTTTLGVLAYPASVLRIIKAALITRYGRTIVVVSRVPSGNVTPEALTLTGNFSSTMLKCSFHPTASNASAILIPEDTGELLLDERDKE